MAERASFESDLVSDVDSLVEVETRTSTSSVPDHSRNARFRQATKAIEAGRWSAPLHSTDSLHSPAYSSPRPVDYTNSARQYAQILDAGPALPPPDYASATKLSYPRFTEYATPNHLVSEARRRRRERYLTFLVVIALLLVGVLIYVLRMAIYCTGPFRLNPFFPDHPTNDNKRPGRFHPSMKPGGRRQSNRQCGHYKDYSPWDAVDYSDYDNFSFRENITLPNLPGSIHDHITGRLEIRPAPPGQLVPLVVWMSVATTEPWHTEWPTLERNEHGVHVAFGSQSQAFATDTPEERKSDKHTAACMDLWIGIYTDLGIQNWDIHTENLDIDVNYPASVGYLWAWQMSSRNSTRISTGRGNFENAGWDAPHIYVETTSGDIGAVFDFSDDITLKTQSGNIMTGVGQKSGPVDASASSKEGEKHSEIPSKIRTENGNGSTSINIIPRWPERDYLMESWHVSDSGPITVYLEKVAAAEGTASGNGLVTLTEEAEERWELIDGKNLSSHVKARSGTKQSHTIAETVDGKIELYLHG